MSIRTSLCICTYNRSDSLSRTLDSLVLQKFIDWREVEVIVVDNSSTDNTPGTVASYKDRLPVRYVFEPVRGLSHARNRAVNEARGDWILFTDDDVILAPNWLDEFTRGLNAYTDMTFGGGRILPDWRGRAPGWFKGEKLDLLDGILGWYDLGAVNRELTRDDPSPFGASFAIRREMFERFGGFRTDLGVIGRGRGRGEETEFIGRLRSAGMSGFYVGGSLCYHFADCSKFKLYALFKYGRASAIAYRATAESADKGSFASALGYVTRGLFQLARGRGDRFRQCVINAGIQVELRTSRTNP